MAPSRTQRAETGNVQFRESIYELRRLLRYVRPYRARLAAGIAALALVGLAEGLIALMFTPLLDRILNPASTDSRLPLLKLPFGGHIVYLNSFVPRSIHYIGTVFGISLVFLFVIKAVAEYLGVVRDPARRSGRDHRFAQPDLRKIGAPAHRLLPDANHRAVDVRSHQRRGPRAQHACRTRWPPFSSTCLPSYLWRWSCS